MMDRVRVRASSLNLAKQCPGSIGLETRDTVATQRGTAIHRWLQAHYEERPEDKPAVDADLSAFVKWFADETELEPFHVEECERELSAPIDSFSDGPHAMLTGHVDAVFSLRGMPIVVDWKSGTGKHPPPIEYDLQMAAYAYLTIKAMPKDKRPESITVFRALVDQKEIAACDYGPEHFAEVEAVVSDIAARQGVFCVGHYCETCLARKACRTYLMQASTIIPSITDRYTGGPIRNAAQAAQIIRALKPAQDLLEEAELAAKQFVRFNGPVFDGGRQWAPSTYEREGTLNAGRASLAKLLEEAGLDAAQIISALEAQGKFQPYVVESWRWRKAL